MWKTLNKVVISQLKPQSVVKEQIRTTFILKRKYEPRLPKFGGSPKVPRTKNYIYELVKFTGSERQPDLQVILTKYVEGLGDVGDTVSVRPNYAYNELLLPGKAVYATEEMMEKYKDIAEQRVVKEHSSPTAQRAVDKLSRLTLTVVMNKDNPWTLAPWHLRSCFRRCGYIVPDECIEMPLRSISGPNLDWEGKEFFVTVTINNFEKVNVRCILHHWSTDILDRLPHDHDFFKRKNEPIFPEDLEDLDKIPSRKDLKEQNKNEE